MITLPRKELAAELALLQTVVGKLTTIPVLGAVKIEAGERLKLTASNIDMTLVSELELPGLMNEPESYCVPAAPLARLVDLFDKDEVTLSPPENGRVKVQCGRSKHLLPYWPAAEFPTVDHYELATTTISGELWSEILKHTTFAMLEHKGDIRQSDQKFTGLHLTLADGKLTVAATDKLRLAIATIPLDGPVFSVIVQQMAIPALKRFSSGTVEIGVGGHLDGFLVVRQGARTLVVRLLDDKPLPWTTLFPASYAHTAEIATDELSAALKRALVTAAERASFVVNGLKWTMSGNELLIESRDGDRGKSDELVALSCPSLNGDALSLGINGQQVVDYLALAGEKTRCEFTAGANVVRLSPVEKAAFDYQYLTNVVNLRW